MSEKRSNKTLKGKTAVPRPFYDPAIREVISEGDLAKMKRMHAQATTLLREQGDLKAAVQRLGKAIQNRERSQ